MFGCPSVQAPVYWLHRISTTRLEGEYSLAYLCRYDHLVSNTPGLHPFAKPFLALPALTEFHKYMCRELRDSRLTSYSPCR